MTGSVAADQEDGRFNDAPGRGGQAVMPADEFRGDQEFVITERTGDSAREIEGTTFQCNGGNGKPLSFHKERIPPFTAGVNPTLADQSTDDTLAGYSTVIGTIK
jgi:hypothetical protein